MFIVLFLFFFLMIRRPPRSTRTDTLFPYTTLFRSFPMRSVFLFIGIGIGEEGEIVAQLNLEPAEPIFVRHVIIMIVRMLIDIKSVVFACFGQFDVSGDVEVVLLPIGEHLVAIFGGGKREIWHVELLSR